MAAGEGHPRRYRVERLGRHHDRAAFSCGEESLDGYLRQRARQDDERNVARVFVLFDDQDNRLAGFFTLSAAAVQLENVPTEARRKLPRFPLVPVVLLGRLATDRGYQGRGLDEALLFDALRRAFEVGTEHIAATAGVVDALHDGARGFYERYGFRRFLDDEYRLYLPMETNGRVLIQIGVRLRKARGRRVARGDRDLRDGAERARCYPGWFGRLNRLFSIDPRTGAVLGVG